MGNNFSESHPNTKSSRDDQLKQEKEQVINYANLYLSPEVSTKFFELKHAGRIGAWWNKKIVLYTAKGKDGNKVRKPIINGVLTVQMVNLNFAEGMSVICDYTRPNGSVERTTLTHIPQQIDGLELFMWVPHFSELHWVVEPAPGKAEVNRLKFGLSFKARSDWTWFNRNNVFAMDLKQFKQTFPDFADVIL